MKNFTKTNTANLLSIAAAGSLLTVVTAVAVLLNEISPAIIL